MPKGMSYQQFAASLRDSDARKRVLRVNGRPFYVLLSQQFARPDIEQLCDTATAIRRLDRHREGQGFLRGVLAGQRIMHLFAQPSTRTAQSFLAGADKLGAQSRTVTDLSTSSFAKGESVEDAVRTLSSFFDTIVTRHHENDFATRAAWALSCSHRPIPVISAGSGRSQHVTQSLLDVYTLRYSFAERGGIDGKTVLIIGDIARNRAARSLAYLMTKFSQPRVYFVSPQEHEPDDDLLAYLGKHGIEVRIHERLDTMLQEHGRQIDAIYVTRLQQEWDEGGPPAERGSSDPYILKPSYRELIRPDCVVMHPLPRVNELPDEWEEHPGFVVWRQVRNGMWIRAALFAVVHGADEEIRARARRLDLL
ncbi:MAG: aspartate carbamoyltransferase [Myxococcales bacterium]|nr:aspartate carbamoyltransferase [Myxococcales bacterium]